MKSSDTFILLGLALILFSFAYPMVTLVVDDTPPEISSMRLPKNGETYSNISQAYIYVRDLESGIKLVFLDIQGYASLTLTKQEDVAGWEKYVTTSDLGITEPGTYSFTWTVYNNADLESQVSGTFTIYDDLAGTWYVAGEEITSSSQTVYATSTTVPFKFVKTSGVEDSQISCIVEEDGTVILTLTNTGLGVWEGSYTFTAGKHVLSLKANDGTNNITFAVVSLDFGGGEQPSILDWFTTQNLLMLFGVLLVGYGVYRRGGVT